MSPSLSAGQLRAIDVYGADDLNAPDIRAAHADSLARLAELYFDDDPEPFRELRRRLTDEICPPGTYAFARISVVPGWGRSDRAPVDVVFDIVEHRDAPRRLPFRPEPTETLDDPAGLLSAWAEYESIGTELMRSGRLGSIACDALHCLYGFAHPSLEPFRDRFETGVPAMKARLALVLREDADPARRAAAAFLLAHSHDPEMTARALTGAIDDPSHLVRNAAMRVLGQMARRPELAGLIPLEPILVAVDYPTIYDRNKALTTLRFLLGSEDSRRLVVERVGDTLVRQLRLTSPINSGPAHEVLRRLSGEDYDRTDVAAWERWIDAQRAAAQPTDDPAAKPSPGHPDP